MLGVALLFVAFFAQERVLFLGALALWVGLCTFGSQYARNFAAYSFVLSGYTVAIPNSPKGGGYSHRIPCRWASPASFTRRRSSGFIQAGRGREIKSLHICRPARPADA